MRRTILTFVIILTLFSPCHSEESDRLAELLGHVGLSRADLGTRPTGFWNRFPLDIPYKLTSFDALWSEPLKLYDYSRVMSNCVALYLDPHYADSAHDGLYKLVYNLGVDKRQGGFRDYSANLIPAPSTDNPLATAIEDLWQLSGQSAVNYAFGSKADWPDVRKRVDSEFIGVPDSAKLALAELIANLGEAIRWRQIAFRNCDPNDMARVMANRDFPSTQTDGTAYFPECDDIAHAIDWPSLYYSALKVASALEQAEYRLKMWAAKIPADFAFDIETPWGKIVFLSAVYKTNKIPTKFFSEVRASLPGYMAIDASNALLIVDFGRNCIYHGSAGATSSLTNPVSAILDLGGNDTYGLESNQMRPNAGVGLCGVGAVLDSKGDDTYFGGVYSQGAGVFGVGVLCDREGNDTYKAQLAAQGCGYFGIGLCLDGTGKDSYYLYGEGQGMGGVGGGVGVLASLDGDDEYIAEPKPSVFNRADYHSQLKINGNNAQGAGFGRRGDGSDGHAWAGGLGALIDINGNDHYYSGNFTLGVGYWFGTGIVYDRTGDDFYESCYFTQASGAHFCNGILIDEGGNDRHELYETAGAGLAFGWDFTNAILINKGGNDIYRAKMISLGLSQIRSNALFFDIGGDDSYYLGENTPGFGESTWRPDFDAPSRLTPYYYYSNSFGGFLDMGGEDRYLSFTEKAETVHPRAGNSAFWFAPAKNDSTYGAKNFGVGMDVDSGVVPDFMLWDKK